MYGLGNFIEFYSLSGRLKIKEGADGMSLLPENSHKACPMSKPDAYCQLSGLYLLTRFTR